MTSVTIFGTGNMGTAIGDLLTGGGASVRHVSWSDEATITDDIVVLAVPYEALNGIAQRYGDQLEGRIVVDITNPVDFDTFDSLKVPVGSSAAAELQAALPDARVLKAINTNFAPTLSAKRVGPNTTTVLVAGDDAKRALIGAVKAGGADAIDAGPLARARTRGYRIPPDLARQRREDRLVRQLRRRRLRPARRLHRRDPGRSSGTRQCRGMRL